MMEASKKNGIVIKKGNDPWAILEYIEAPMWVDLTIEAKSSNVDKDDDEWFNTSHPFHQLSAHQLKSKFSHGSEEILISRVDLQAIASPELPSSVSRSRGKHYNSKKLEGVDLNILLDKQNGLSRTGLRQGSNFGQGLKSKSKSNVNSSKGSFAKLGSAFDRNSREKTESMTSCSTTGNNSNSMDNKTGRSTARSTITSENTLQQQKYREQTSGSCDQKSRNSSLRRVSLGKGCVTKKVSRIGQQKCVEVSSQPCGHKNGSSSVSCVRKSYVTRKASKVELGGGSMQSRDPKSSSRKSSVASCSNPGYEVKFVSRSQREKITDEKGEVTVNLGVKSQHNPCEISRTSTISIEEAQSGNRKARNINFAKPAYRRTAMSLVQHQSTSSKALLQCNVNKENTCTGGAKEKLRTTKVSSLTGKGKENAIRNVGKGKENATRNVTANKKCIEKAVPAGAMLKNHSTTQHNHLQKGDTEGSTALRILGRDTHQREAKNPVNLPRRIYLR